MRISPLYGVRKLLKAVVVAPAAICDAQGSRTAIALTTFIVRPRTQTLTQPCPGTHPLNSECLLSCSAPGRPVGAPLASMASGAAAVRQVAGAVDQCDVGKGLRKIAGQPLGDGIVLLGDEADVVAQGEQPLVKIARIVY